MRLFIKDYINDPGAESREIDIKYKHVTLTVGDALYRIAEEHGKLCIQAISPATMKVYPRASNTIYIKTDQL